MKYVYPDFYFDFKCIADKCRHSCCVDWEIDIDGESLEFYQNLEGKIGEDIRKNIAAEPDAHFVLTEHKRCPMLRKDGLCRIICELGEEALCDICSEHPRFYNCFSDREYAGLGLCCEEAARLLLEGDATLGFICEDDGGESYVDEFEHSLFKLEDKIYSLLSDRSLSMHERIADVFSMLNAGKLDFQIPGWAEFMLKLERLDDNWTELLCVLKDRGDRIDLSLCLNNVRYERLMQYFVFRHFAMAADMENAQYIIRFCGLSVCIIAALDYLLGYDAEHTRLYSSEIEYSDENKELILAKIATIKQ